ncbi:hypothetical protein Tco_1300313 [Tanacetum coccineum]
MRIIIRDRNVQEELLKKELHSVKMQLNSTINHNKLIKEEVTKLKKDFKQKENKYLEEFLDMKQLKEKVEDKLYKQDQSLQTVHMLCKPKIFYDEKKKVAIGYENPLYLTKAKKVQPALYNGHELVKTTHTPAVVHDSEDTLELAETTRMKMLEKSKKSVSAPMVAAVKLPVLNPGEFELWKMRIEQYFLMTDYALWESISLLRELTMGSQDSVSPDFKLSLKAIAGNSF